MQPQQSEQRTFDTLMPSGGGDGDADEQTINQSTQEDIKQETIQMDTTGDTDDPDESSSSPTNAANQTNANNYNHQCFICDKTFSGNSNLNRHLRKIHKENVQSPYNNVKCALCESLYPSSSMYIVHLEDDHKVQINVEKLTFKTKSLFEDWKHAIESATTSQFIKSRGQKRTRDVNKTYYSCNRSGYYVSKARTQKALKKQGSRKINGRCPASMNVTVNSDSSYDVKFIKTHVGHDFELKHLDLSEKDRELIVRKLTSGVTKKDIIRQIRSTTELHQKGNSVSFSIHSPASDGNSNPGDIIPSSSTPAISTPLNIQPIVINSRSSIPGCSEQQIEVVVPAASIVPSDINIVPSLAVSPTTRSTTQANAAKLESQAKQLTIDATDSTTETTTTSPSKAPTLTQITTEITNPQISRLHLATTKDIHNILNSKHLDSKKIRHNYDLHAIEAWASEMKDYNDESTVLFYKDQSELVEKYPRLRDDDFMLVIMKPGQAELLKELGPKCVVVDSTYNVHCEYLHLTYLSVVDDEHHGFPVAYLFSSRTDADTIEVFFSLLKDRVGLIATRILIADELHDFYAAWWKVMSMPLHNLLTPWSVFDEWSKRFKLIRNREKVRKIKKQLRALITETETDKFKGCLQQILVDYKRDADTSKFLEYFEQQYAKNPDVWSSCLRKNYDISNYQLWNMHEKFKTVYKEGKNSKKMCKYVTCLMNLFEDYQLEKLLQIEESNQDERKAIIDKRHKKGIETGSIVYEVAVDPAYWLCPSECSSDVYDEVRQSDDVKTQSPDSPTAGATAAESKSTTPTDDPLVKKDRKCCELKCSECHSCRHEYKCTCLDYVVNFNMCKHIHRISALCKQG